MSGNQHFCTDCGFNLHDNAFCEECGASADDTARRSPTTPPLALPSSPISEVVVVKEDSDDVPNPEGKLTGLVDAVGGGVNKAVLALLGLVYSVGSVVLLSLTGDWWLLLVLAYGIYVLSGLVTGGSRWLVY